MAFLSLRHRIIFTCLNSTSLSLISVYALVTTATFAASWESRWESFALISSPHSLSAGHLTGKKKKNTSTGRHILRGGSGETDPARFLRPQIRPCLFLRCWGGTKNVSNARCQTGPCLLCGFCYYFLLIRRYNTISPFCPNQIKAVWW